jgi:N-acetylmuramoyl-L-alanine amidase
MVEEEFGSAGRLSLGVKQRNEKGIWVLQATGMPSILVETGFLTNHDEEDYLNSEKGQDEITNNILNAVKRYKTTIESKLTQGSAPGAKAEKKPASASNLPLIAKKK